MSGGMHRFLSRRDKKHTHHRDTSHTSQHSPIKIPSTPDHFGGIFTLDDANRGKFDKEDEKKIKAVLARLQSYGIENLVEANVEYALRAPSSKGDPEEAFRLLMLLEDTYEGIVRPYSAEARLLGAENRQNVTCYLDALLFAMFARLDSFEAMLYEGFTDIPRRKLAGMLRLWVNMLRAGKLITADLTRHLQEALAECGWEDAANLRQQDPSEAFGFITGQLELPLLTLKMDLYHTGKEDPHDDHKFVNERLLEVAIPEGPSEGSSVITLEDCLEHYFNNRIEVKRHMEAQRRNTLQSSKADEDRGYYQDEKHDSGLHVEVAEIPGTPSTPITESPFQTKNPVEKLRPTAGRKRADSIFSQRRVDLQGVDAEKTESDDTNPGPDGSSRLRKMSTTRTEVLMPAWQFFKLLPWYTDHLPTSDAQVAAHFSQKRPVLGICLKRYFYTITGEAKRRDTYIDIPLEIAVPNFVSDDNMQEHGPLVGNFRLLLQSVVCHRGNSVHSGHYICLSRGQATNAQSRQRYEQRDSDSDSDDEPQDPWMRFDDLSKERISFVNIRQALKEETPYMLFYQVQPIGDDGRSIHDLPSYAEATSRTQSNAAPTEKRDPGDPDMALTDTISEPRYSISEQTTEATDFGALPSTRTSIDAGVALGQDPFRGRSSASFTRDARRPSVAFTDGSHGGSTASGSVKTTNSTPSTPSEEKSNAFLSVAKNIGSRRASRVSTKDSTVKPRSRPTSAGPGDKETSRFSLNMSKLTSRMSRTDMSAANNQTAINTSANAMANTAVPNIQPSDIVAAELANEKDAYSPTKQLSAISITALPSADDEPSQASAALPSKPAPLNASVLSKKDRAAAKKEKRHNHHHGGTGQEERDCVVM